MEMFCSSLGALAVAMLYYAYRDHHQAEQRKQRTLASRVAYLLWAMAEQTT